MKKKKCVLYDRDCINCGECNVCDLNPNKICDNCCECLELEKEAYRTLKISRIITDQEELDAYMQNSEREEREEEGNTLLPAFQESLEDDKEEETWFDLEEESEDF